jgi:RNA polymerase-binding transcription factor DksA
MSQLSAAQKATLAQRLRLRSGELHADVERELAKGESYRQLAGEAADAGDASLADLIVDLDHAEVDRDLAELRAVDDAIARLPGPGFGVCVECGQDIAFERLEAQPQVTRCVRCQERRERRYLRDRPGPTL